MVKTLNILKYCSLIMLCCLTSMAWSQSRTVTGSVTSGDEKALMPGVSILEKGTSNGAISDGNGQFSLQVSGEFSVLVFSFVGYASQEVVVGNLSNLNITLAPDVANLEEVVVIGYGTVKKSDATGSVTALRSRDFNKGVVNSPQELIAGKIAGVSITSISGAPGNTSTIRIRGGSSLSASNDPLIVIDNVPITNSDLGGSANILSTINPNDIETFTVLKDASATAIYGLRASNGVIMITTKRGSRGLKLNYNATATLYTTPKKLEVYSGDEFRNLINSQYGSIPGHPAPTMLGDANTDWQKEIYQNAVGMDHSISATGTAFKKLPYRVSIGYNNTDGILKTYNFERTTASIGLDPSFFNDALKVSINVKGMINDNNFADQAAIGDAIAYDPTQPVHNGNTRYRGYTTWTTTGSGINGDPVLLGPANPVARLELTDNTSRVKRSIGNVKLDYAIPLIKGLTATLNLAYDVSESVGHNNVKDKTQWVYQPTVEGGRYNPYQGKMNNKLLDFYLNYSKDLKSIDSKFDVTGGYSYAYFHSSGADSTMNAIGESAERTNVYETDYVLLSFFGRANYTFKNKYLLTGTLRADATSRFGGPEGTPWGIFPSVAFAWKIKEEGILKSVETISDLKLRVGYGITGQQDIAGGDYPYLPTYTISDPAARYRFGNTYYNTLRPNPYDANIRWETTTTVNIGLDYGLFENRITGSLDVYHRKTKDLIAYIDVPVGTNFSPFLTTNVGSISNTGIELGINAEVVSNDEWEWNVGYNITFNKNEVTKLNLTDDPNTSVPVGEVQIHKIGYSRASYYVYQQVYDANGKPIENVFVDRNNDGVVNTEDRYIYKKPDATVYMGINSRVRYKNLDLSLSGRASLNNYVYNSVAAGSTYLALYSSLGYIRNMSTAADDTKFTNAVNTRFSDYYIENASYFRLDNINVGYTFSNIVKDKLTIRVGAGVQNAFVITKYSGLDPEISGGVDNNFFPRTRAFLLNLNCTF